MRTYSIWLAPLFLGLLTPTTARTAAAQGETPPIHGFNATIALSETIEKFYSDVHIGLEKVGDGIEHLARATKGTKVRGGAAALEGLQPGTAVVVQYTVKGIRASADDEARQIGPNGSSVNEGTVMRVDPSRKRITVRFANGATETLRAPEDSDTQRSSRVVVYRSDESGHRVARYFKPVH
jgi:hypothetical protein